MDWTTFVGFFAGGAVVYYGLAQTESLSAFLNLHGLVLVVGGTLSAMLINTPLSLLGQAILSLRFLFTNSAGITPREAIQTIVTLADKARKLGHVSIENDGQGLGDGFLQAAIDACLFASDEKLARDVLNQRLRQERARHTEVTNVFRTMAVLFPMFGLIGTLIGIVTVLKNISNPKNVGVAMAVALSTAFFGILFANLLCVPIAGKLRLKALDEEITKEILAEGVLKIFFTSQISTQIGLYLESYIARRAAERAKEEGVAGGVGVGA